jgi:cytidylate kinase
LEVAGRDERDRNRLVAPLKPATDAIVIDTSTLSIDEVFNRVYAEVQKKGLKGAIL